MDVSLKADSLRSERARLIQENPQSRSRARRRYWLIGAGFILVILFTAGVPRSRNYILRTAGKLLVLDQPTVQPADIIVVAIDADGAGALEAADLVHRGVSDRVAVFDDPPSKVDLEFIRRGFPYEDRAAVSTRQLQWLGVSNVEQIPRTTSGSEQEGEILPDWCDKHNYHSVLLITSSDHSRRLSRILRRSVRGYQLNVIVQGSRYSGFDPDSWWKSREGVRDGLFELEKLLLDIARHPFV